MHKPGSVRHCGDPCVRAERGGMYCSQNCSHWHWHCYQVASLSRDKFLVTAVLLDREDIPAAQLADALRTQTPDGQYRSLQLVMLLWQWLCTYIAWYYLLNRLRCNLAGAPETGSGIGQVYASPPPATAPEDPARQVCVKPSTTSPGGRLEKSTSQNILNLPFFLF